MTIARRVVIEKRGLKNNRVFWDRKKPKYHLKSVFPPRRKSSPSKADIALCGWEDWFLRGGAERTALLVECDIVEGSIDAPVECVSGEVNVAESKLKIA